MVPSAASRSMPSSTVFSPKDLRSPTADSADVGVVIWFMTRWSGVDAGSRSTSTPDAGALPLARAAGGLASDSHR
jgi:hypothetical protein